MAQHTMTKERLQKMAKDAGLSTKLVDLDRLIGAKKGYLSNMRSKTLPPLVANFFKLAIETKRPRETFTILVREIEEDGIAKLEIKKEGTTLIFPYDIEKTYIGNILSFFPKFGIIDFKSEDDRDIITLIDGI